MHPLQIQLDDNKSQLALALQQKEMMSIKLSEVSELMTSLENLWIRWFFFALDNELFLLKIYKYNDSNVR